MAFLDRLHLKTFFAIFVVGSRHWPGQSRGLDPALTHSSRSDAAAQAFHCPIDIFSHPQDKHSFPNSAAASFPTLLSTGEATSAVLGPALSSPVQERDALTGASPVQGHKDDEGSEASFI